MKRAAASRADQARPAPRVAPAPPVQPRRVARIAEPDQFLEEMATPGRQELVVQGTTLRPGSRVRLVPRPGGDLLDRALAGRSAIVEGIDEDDSGAAHVAVVVESDPGRGLGTGRHPAHRFFFAPEELEPLEPEQEAGSGRRVLVAGIGNIFLGDDGFGVAVANLLAERELPAGVDVVDFGIRGRDLAYALGEPYHAAILVDLVAPGREPGKVVVLEPDLEDEEPHCPDGHRLDPVSVLRLAMRLGPVPERILIVGCSPVELSESWSLDTVQRLSEPVAQAARKAADLVVELAQGLVSRPEPLTAP